MKNKIFAIGLAALAMGMASCDSYLDINDNPNSPLENTLTASMLFPGAELNFANQYGCRLRIFGGYYSQYYAQLPGTSNYLPMAGFTQTSALSNTVYAYLCERTLNNLNIARNIAEQSGDWGSYLACTVMKAATYQILVDCYGAVPYFEGMNVTGTMTPKYDDGKDIYLDLLDDLDKAIEKTPAGFPVCTNYMLNDQLSDAWVAAANALKLRMLMRISGVVDVKAKLADLVAQNNFPRQDLKWAGIWSATDGQTNTNPFYYEEFASGRQKNVCLNVALKRAMDEIQDAREGAYFEPINTNGDFQGWVSSSTAITSASQYYDASGYSRPTTTPTSTVYFITVAETEFFLAEYEQRYGSAAAAQAHYEAAVKASFASAGLSAADAQVVLDAYPYDANKYMELIGIQKWLHLSGVNPFEGYCELRRIGYPTFGTAQGTDIYSFSEDVLDISVLEPGKLYTPIQVDAAVGANHLLQRWPYPSSSQSTNSNVPTFEGATTPIFWAK